MPPTAPARLVARSGGEPLPPDAAAAPPHPRRRFRQRSPAPSPDPAETDGRRRASPSRGRFVRAFFDADAFSVFRRQGRPAAAPVADAPATSPLSSVATPRFPFGLLPVPSVFHLHPYVMPLLWRGRMAREKPIDDSDWPEVHVINSYALFMGYLSMAVRGVGLLLFTWTTVVLLGGFVNVLEKKDFWCLTLITLVQIARFFDVKKKEKLSYIGKSFWGIFCTVSPIVGDDPSWKRRLVAAVVLLVQQLVFAALLFPLAALYVCGLLITAGMSLWRLIENNYYGGNAADRNAANLKPALNVLYSLALFQGVLFCYRHGASHAERWLVDTVVGGYGFTDLGRKSVKRYLRETRIECEKDPSFARGRNLITYAVGLMQPVSSSGDYVSGATILDTLLVQPELVEHHKLIKQLLIGSVPSSHVLQKLLQVLDSRCRHGPDDGEIRMLTTRIVAHLAGDIRLEQFPRGIHSLSFLLDASQQQDNDSAPSADYKELMVQGLLILEKLAADEDNCRAISNAQGLLSKVMAPVSSDVLHRMDHGHGAWSGLVDASLQILCRLVTARGEAGTKLCREISSNKEALSTMESIFKCDQCNEQLHIRAMEILTQLSMGTEIRESFMKKLLGVFADDKMGSDIRGLAGEKLAALSLKSKSDAVIVLQANGDVGDLTKILLEDESNKCRISAVGILEGLCIHCTDDVECVKNMNKTMTDAMPKVLEAIFCCGLTGQKIQTGTEAHTVEISSTVTDIEEGQDCITSSPQNIEQPEDMVHELQEAFLSLSTTILDNLVRADQDLAHPFVGHAAFSFAGKLKEMVERNSQPTIKCLRTMKLASKLAISMMRHEFVKVQDMESFMQSLSKASDDMSDLDGVMFISSGNHGATNSARTLESLVKEARSVVNGNLIE